MRAQPLKKPCLPLVALCMHSAGIRHSGEMLRRWCCQHMGHAAALRSALCSTCHAGLEPADHCPKQTNKSIHVRMLSYTSCPLSVHLQHFSQNLQVEDCALHNVTGCQNFSRQHSRNGTFALRQTYVLCTSPRPRPWPSRVIPVPELGPWCGEAQPLAPCRRALRSRPRLYACMHMCNDYGLRS